MQTLSFQAPEALNQQLELCAKAMDRSKAWLIRQALTAYIADLQDYEEVKAYKASYNPQDNVSLEDIKRLHKID